MAVDLTPPYLTAPSLSGLDGIAHGFFGREGGVSDGIYAALNCGHGSKDQRVAVSENRRRVAAALGQERAEQVVTLYQVHSAKALVVETALPREALPQADALVTRTRGLILGALAADCTPVLFADPQAKVVAAAHAGWRGAFSGILEATLATMESIGAERRRIRAGIGPTINQAAYEVGPEFEANFLAADPDAGRFFRTPHGGRAHFDLPGFVEYRLRAAGLMVVDRQTLCTFDHPDRYFSYRRSTKAGEPDYGRQISAIVLT